MEKELVMLVVEVERVEVERIEVERIEVERIEVERVEMERVEVERVEVERVEVEGVEFVERLTLLQIFANVCATYGEAELPRDTPIGPVS